MISKNKVFIFSAILLLFVVAGCGAQSENGQSNDGQATEETGEQQKDKTSEKSVEKTAYPADVEENPIVTITMENDKEITLELYPTTAPNTVANFISLIEEGFYDGVIFHRVIPDFMIQGGDPEGNGTGGPGYSIAGEFSSNGFENNLKHERGVISMARAQDPNSAGSQFFIMVTDYPSLDGEYAAFGKVLEGMEVVDEIVSTQRDESDKPLEDQKMKSVVVDTKGYDYPKPEKQ
ncbi:peptidylprolyl isomerase [Aquibacillus sp. 3ASR75-11]|uniref:Peptidyl-prolyl cis-trans isomerase n=1 Tax=Terrihalobacillus insolitus TaxID=2950438 RepID=A0A9X3WVN6_9BACI|nr:peptidylprolyl isomerase [Terrihalobacillus insolitus]MDC3414713.1 peptidylprolyl isomerase [Terrihalobacillus insolitus]MDC3424174.1 peptidylprolyl isomerase [Terrihalobacillus insolitus]